VRTWVLTRAAAEPATRTPLSESAAAIRVFMGCSCSWKGVDRDVLTVRNGAPRQGRRSSKKRPRLAPDSVNSAPLRPIEASGAATMAR
jgi:hypothetical protein